MIREFLFSTATTACADSDLIFQIKLSELDLYRLRHYKFLGFDFQKSKYRFLLDLRDVLTEEILSCLEQMEPKP